MASLNKVQLIGNLGKDPELRYTGSGQAVANFSLATSERWVTKENEKQERTEWHRVVVWGKQGENCAKYLKKGRSVYVEGRIQTREWKDKDGQTRYTSEIVAVHVLFLGGRDEAGGGSSYGESEPWAGQSPPESTNYNESFSDDDIPF